MFYAKQLSFLTRYINQQVRIPTYSDVTLIWNPYNKIKPGIPNKHRFAGIAYIPAETDNPNTSGDREIDTL